MREVRYFEIPSDIGMVLDMIAAIPSDWSRISGELLAPTDAVALGFAEENTGLYFSTSQPAIVGKIEKGDAYREKTNLLPVALSEKWPGFYTFASVRYNHEDEDSEVFRSIATAALRKGYYGNLSFQKEYFDHDAGESVCSLIFQSWEPASYSGEGDGIQAPRARINFADHYYGTQDVAILIARWHTLNVRQYTLHNGARIYV